MKTVTIEIVDRGRGPQLSTSRITVMDVFYWLHRGYRCDQILTMIPALSREELDAISAYVKIHHKELVEQDRRVDEIHEKGIAAQRARGGICAGVDETLTKEERMARRRQRLQQKIAEKK